MLVNCNQWQSQYILQSPNASIIARAVKLASTRLQLVIVQRAENTMEISDCMHVCTLPRAAKRANTQTPKLPCCDRFDAADLAPENTSFQEAKLHGKI